MRMGLFLPWGGGATYSIEKSYHRELPILSSYCHISWEVGIISRYFLVVQVR